MSLDAEHDVTEAQPGTGLCELCGEDAALPNDDFCRECLLEVEAALAQVERPDFWRPTGECPEC